MEKSTGPSVFFERILNSPTFSNKEVQKSLLCFLFSAAKEHRTLREIDIAFDFFKRGNSFQPGDDTIVRVSIHKLRSLLEKYYQNEGQKDELVFELPKGCYSLKVITRAEHKIRPIKKSRFKKVLYGLLAVSVLLNLLLVLKIGFTNGAAKNPVWNDYLKSKLPVCITLGDPFFFRVTNDTSNESLIIRDISINSKEDLLKGNATSFFDHQMKITDLDYPYFSSNNIRPLPDIISVFSKANIDVRLQTLSETKMEDIKRNNHIFIGNINSFGFFSKFLEQTSVTLRTNPREIIINKGTENLVLSVPEKINGYYMDYAFMVKIPGTNNTVISLLGDFHASGIKGLAHFITDQTSISVLEKEIQKKYGKFPEFFEMVVKVTSYNYIDFKTEMLYFNPLPLKSN